MKRKSLLLTLLSVVLFGLTACSSDSESENNLTTDGHKLQFKVDVPEHIKDLYDATLSFTEKNSKRSSTVNVEVDANHTFTTQLKSGLYDFKFVAKAKVDDKENTFTGYLQNEQVNQPANFELTAYAFVDQADFVIEEIFYRGNVYPGTKKTYIGDQYIKITNNSDQTLYADGLAIAESKFTSSLMYTLSPDIREEAVTIQAIYAIPGNGKEHPVKPGESLILTDKAINHIEGFGEEKGNPNSFDLSNADFEWYDETDGATTTDIDNPNVPNLDKIYSYTKTIWILSMQGNRSYFLVRMPKDVSKAKFLAEYKYDYSFRMPNIDRDVKQSEYKVPNSWVVDAVNLAAPDKDSWNIISPTLDAGRTFCGENSKDPASFGTSVRRKVAYTNENGRKVLQDTNNSTDDFEGTVQPSIAQ